MPATGTWHVEAVVAADWLRALTKVPRPGDPLLLEVRGGRLRIGRVSIACSCRAPGTTTDISFPLGADLQTRLRAGLEHDDASLAGNGLLPLVAIAREEMERRIVESLEVLAPLGITAEDLRLLVAAKVARPNG